MAEKTPLMYEAAAKSPYDVEKINPAGQDIPRVAESLNSAEAAAEKYAESLRERYAQPNWFKMSAAFAKPQLGGFFASLGSAADVLGEQVEQQRAIEPTIYKMRSEIAAKRAGLTQRSEADAMLEAYSKANPGKPFPPELIAKVEKLAPGSSQSSAAKLSQEATGKAITNAAAAVKAESENPMIDTMRLVLGGKEKTPEEVQALQSQITSNRPPQISPEEWAVLPIEQKMARQAQYAKDQALMGLDETQKSAVLAKGAFDTLPMLHTIRDLAMGTGIKGGQEEMAKALNYFGGNSPFDAVARAAADGRLVNGRLEGFDQYARQTNMSPEVRDNFQKLVKLLADYQVRAVNASVNPTDAYSALKQQGSPNIGNSQKSLVTLTDLLGHAEKHSLNRYTQTMNVPALQRIEALKPLEEAYGKEHAKIATSDPFKYAPSWYSPSAPAPVAAPARAPVAAPATTGAAPAAGSMQERLMQEQARRAQARQP
jgi:hypothetical protein